MMKNNMELILEKLIEIEKIREHQKGLFKKLDKALKK